MTKHTDDRSTEPVNSRSGLPALEEMEAAATEAEADADEVELGEELRQAEEEDSALRRGADTPKSSKASISPSLSAPSPSAPTRRSGAPGKS